MVNGMRTAVKHGEWTEEQALEWLETQAQSTGYLSKRAVAWLKRRIARRK